MPVALQKDEPAAGKDGENETSAGAEQQSLGKMARALEETLDLKDVFRVWTDRMC